MKKLLTKPFRLTICLLLASWLIIYPPAHSNGNPPTEEPVPVVNLDTTIPPVNRVLIDSFFRNAYIIKLKTDSVLSMSYDVAEDMNEVRMAVPVQSEYVKLVFNNRIVIGRLTSHDGIYVQIKKQ